MSMINLEDPATFARGFRDRSRMSWGAVLAGAVVAVATILMLNLLGAAMGAGAIRPLDATSADVSRFGIAAGIWEVINLALSMALGGYVTARLSGTHSHLDGELHGMTMWASALLIGALLLAWATSGVLGLVGQGASSVVSSTASGARAISGAGLPEVGSALTNRLMQSLSNSGDPTTMSREQINGEIATLVGGGLYAGGLSDTDRNRLIDLVAAQFGITKEEAALRVNRMEGTAKATLAQVEQKTREAADAVAAGAASAARALFTALVLGLLAALVGAWIGTRHKRVLHPVVEVGHDIHVPSHVAPHVAPMVHETVVRPSSISVYEDSGHLVWQYLRDVSFPVNKQDLLRMARAGNNEPSLLQSIEALPEGSYANANEVLRALAH
jgi:hypothetical protein